MPRRDGAVHALKVTAKAGRVMAMGLAHDGRAAKLADRFRARLAARLCGQPGYGRTEIITVPGQPDWFVIFYDLCSELALDELLKTVASALETRLYLEPAVPVQDMTGSFIPLGYG
ncbi:MAG TPA: hypothetical protein VLF67_02585 [Candidatus Saccharimonas sp.]|nr:hypothetical protein [Candidatus Saccharimonas sp.]